MENIISFSEDLIPRNALHVHPLLMDKVSNTNYYGVLN